MTIEDEIDAALAVLDIRTTLGISRTREWRGRAERTIGGHVWRRGRYCARSAIDDPYDYADVVARVRQLSCWLVARAMRGLGEGASGVPLAVPVEVVALGPVPRVRIWQRWYPWTQRPWILRVSLLAGWLPTEEEAL